MDTIEIFEQQVSKDLKLDDIRLLSQNPLIDSLMNFVGGMIAILNEKRKILAINVSFLQYMNIDNPENAKLLTPGEYLNCVHVGETPGGCGTGKYCATCGISKVLEATLKINDSKNGTCAFTQKRNGENFEIFFKVSSSSILIDGKQLILLFLQDNTNEHRTSTLERVFYHDLNNLITGLLGKSELLCLKQDGKLSELSRGIYKLTSRMAQEIKIQQFLSKSLSTELKFNLTNVSSESIIDELHQMFAQHLAAKEKKLIITGPKQHFTFDTDNTLLMKVVGNMIINALEASKPGEEVNIEIKRNDKFVIFSIRNNGVIPEDIQKRIFQRHFSTKNGQGRGLGTYSMKLFGEEILGGKVDFISTIENGTIFSFSIGFKA